ncbi:hypothetical protein ATE47_03410 [Chryseobacterium sp. IHB B 17019]|uniref:hypothetical protein n=1 Tax=Chryseobacterium TaxID=59732 RepID=UPI0007225A9A|nr:MULTISPECIES: hypothetical protein [Chryseobacterium]ALR29632.1 hypothetical protein ATE47_03410 [Chryseobacterium sp. IHB B 17019]MDQ0595433.1 hypothetical protein [Chryseobacterium ginsenosidimutans]
MRKIFKILIVLVCVIAGLFLWFDQSRSFFKATNGEYITMWKRYGGTCYLIPGKYYGITKPNNDYVETENKNEYVDFLWFNNKSNYLLYSGNVTDKIYNTDNADFRIINYLNDKQKNDSLFTEKKGHYSHYKKGVARLSINILEGYASDGTGKTQR